MQTRSERQHREELAKAAEERDALQDKLTQLQDKVDPQIHNTSVILYELLDRNTTEYELVFHYRTTLNLYHNLSWWIVLVVFFFFFNCINCNSFQVCVWGGVNQLTFVFNKCFLTQYTVSEQHWITAKKKLERKMAELQNKVAQQEETSGDTTAKVRHRPSRILKSVEVVQEKMKVLLLMPYLSIGGFSYIK